MKKVVQLYTISMSIRFVEGMSEPLKKAGYELIVISADGPEARRGEKNGEFRFYPVEMARGISPVQNLKAWFRIRRILKTERPDIVHGNTPIGGLLALSAAWSLGIQNRIFTLHGLRYPGERGMKRLIVRMMEKKTLHLARKVFAVSEGLRQLACEEHLCEPDKIKVLHHGSVKGIDPVQTGRIREKGREYYEKSLGLDTKQFRFGFFGRITEEKGLVELLEAYKILKAKGYDFHAIFCGAEELADDRLKQKFEDYVSRTNSGTYGMVTNPLEYMMCCDCVVLPTHREGFGLVNLEANSLGIPAVTTNIMGCKDSIEDGVTGLFVKVNDPADLAEKMELIIQDPKLRQNMGQAGIQRAEKLFNRKDIWAELVREYDDCTRKEQA